MPQPGPITLATVTFEGDLRLTVLQALSIDRLYDLDGLAEYLVVLNGADNDALRADLTRHLEGRVSAHLGSKMRFLTPSDLPRGGDGSGWYGQQVIKLALHEIVTTSAYLMLDAKNHFVRPSNADDFFYDGLPITQFTKTTATWDKYVRAALDTLDALTDERAAEMMPTTTPYLMLTDEVRDAVARVEAKYTALLPDAIRQTGGATEFFLYYAHLVSSFDTIPYANRPSMTRTLYTSWPQDHEKVLEIIGDATSADVPMFGLHRKRLPQLSEPQRRAIADLWARHLLKEWEDTSWFMAY